MPEADKREKWPYDTSLWSPWKERTIYRALALPKQVLPGMAAIAIYILGKEVKTRSYREGHYTKPRWHTPQSRLLTGMTATLYYIGKVVKKRTKPDAGKTNEWQQDASRAPAKIGQHSDPEPLHYASLDA